MVIPRLATCLALTLLALTAAASPVRAADYPSQPIRIVVPFSAGGGNDIVARMLAKRLDASLRVPIVVENRPGAGGNIGLRAAAAAKPDGHTVGYASNGVVMNPYLYRDVGFDIQSDFDPVALIATTPIWLLATPKSGIESVADLIAKAKANPGGLTYASPGVGTPHHLGAELLQSLAGIQLVHVPYKGASGAATDAVGGQVDVLISTPASIRSFVASGQLRALASMDARRDEALPDLPVVAETVPGFETTIWHGILVPAGTDPEVVERLSGTVREALAEPAFQHELATVGFTALYEGPAKMRSRLEQELAMWGDVTRQAGIRPE